MRQRNLNLVLTTMLILEKNKIYSEILRAMDIYGSACFEPEIPRTSLSNDRVMLHYSSRPDNDMYYHDSNFKMSTCPTVKGSLIELVDQTELYYCVSSVFLIVEVRFISILASWHMLNRKFLFVKFFAKCHLYNYKFHYHNYKF